MNRDEARKLVGGYATGSLTDAERRALFTAALDDQDLFDQLGDEQSLKDLLAEPGVRERLIAGLAPTPEKRRWSWMWVGAAAALAGSATLAVMWFNVPKPAEQAQVTSKVELPSPFTAPGPPRFDENNTAPPQPQAEAPAKRDVEQPKAKVADNRPVKAPEVAEATVARRDTAAVASPGEPPALKSEQATGAIGGVLVPPLTPPAPALARGFAPAAVAAAPPKPAPSTANAIEQAGAQKAAVAPLSVADSARSGFVAGATFGQGGFVQVQTFGFRYQVSENLLQVTPTSVGWLTVTTADAVPMTLFANRAVPSGVPVAIPVPLDAKELTIQFSMQAGTVASAPQRRTTTTGLVAADSQVAITIPARP